MLRTVILLLSLSGCSFVLVSGPPENHAQLPSFDCTTSRLGPGLDVVWTALQTLNLVGAVSSSDAQWNDEFKNNPPFARTTAIPVYGVLAALGAAGMYYGFTRTSACRSAKAELAARSQQPGGAPTQPGTWPPPAGGPQPTYPPPQQPGYPPAQPQPQGYPPAPPQR